MSMSAIQSLKKLCFKCRYYSFNGLVSFEGLSKRAYLLRNGTQAFNSLSSRRNLSMSASQMESSSLHSSHQMRPSSEQPQGDTKVVENGMPWYLQVAAQEPLGYPMKSQAFPKLPSDAPEKLQSIVQHLLINIGLDDLALIDLRKLDPPPALGGNLLMIVGTARSERHLHVSADRFCRWLRTECKFRPYADGLLGRNELKLKLRRKARRAKLLGSSSRKMTEDDGIRSDWVCVSVGAIEKSQGTEHSLEDDNITGFGGREDGTQLVVQMFTEDKREELALESLWSSFLRRQDRRDKAESAVAGDQDTEQEMSAEYYYNRHLSVSATNGSSSTKLRAWHPKVVTTQTRSFYSNAVSTSTQQSREPSEVLIQENYDYVNSQLNPLQYLHRGKALAMLGNNAYDKDSTAFLAELYSGTSALTLDDWARRIGIVRYALAKGHQGYRVDDLVDILQEAQESSPKVSPKMYELAVRSIMELSGGDPAVGNPDISKIPRRLVEAFQDISFQIEGLSPVTLQSLVAAFEQARLVDIESGQQGVKSDSAVQFADILGKNPAFVTPLSFAIMVLSDLSICAQWNKYWRYWRQLPADLLRRPQILYVAMFTHLSQTRHQRMCCDALTEWIPYLSIEQPPVLIEADLASAVMECLKVADPAVESQAILGINEKGQWVRLWRKCEKGLGKEPEDTTHMQAEAFKRYGNSQKIPIGNTQGSESSSRNPSLGNAYEQQHDEIPLA